jgi:hypothetical protein
MHYSRSHDAVIRVYDAAGNVIRDNGRAVWLSKPQFRGAGAALVSTPQRLVLILSANHPSAFLFNKTPSALIYFARLPWLHAAAFQPEKDPFQFA